MYQLHLLFTDAGCYSYQISWAQNIYKCSIVSNWSYLWCYFLFSVGSPNCPNIQTNFTKVDSFAVSIQQLHKTWLTVCYTVEVTSTNMSIVTMHNSTITSDGLVDVTSLQPGTVYNISVTPCNMAGCNESCDMYSVQTTVVPTGVGEYGIQSHPT